MLCYSEHSNYLKRFYRKNDKNFVNEILFITFLPDIEVRLRRPYIAVLANWNKEKRSVDIFFFHIDQNAKHKQFLVHNRLFFVYEKELLRVYRYIRIGKKSTIYLKPREATEDLQKAVQVFIPEDDLPWDVKGLIEYCETFKIKRPKKAKLCFYCLQNREKWTEIKDSEIYLKGKRICNICAKKEIESELKRRNLVVTDGITKFYLAQSQRAKKLDNVLDEIIMGSEIINITEETSKTLFDVIEAKPIEREVRIENVTNLPPNYIKLLKNEKITTFLPIQVKAIEKGLLNGVNLLVVAGTSSGKTLVGELAGISTVLKKKKKFVYLSPLVALTNQKYDQFKKRYRKLGLNVAIRVGMSRIVVEGEFKPIIDEDYKNAEIIVATYEAFDYLLRDVRKEEIGNIGTIVIDEIQMLMDEDRGFRLNGLIARLKALFPQAQYIYLSATIGNPEELARNLEAELVTYLERPIPLERHVVITESDEQRLNYIIDLCKNEEKLVSSYGYRGQTLVFTNSRRNCESLAKELSKKGIKATYYHAGLTFQQRRKIEHGFERGRYSTVVTTIALGAGVDFPASLVIFESLAMGIKWLKVAEFHQMLGRAGRLGFHEKGKVYLLVEPGRKIYVGQEATEEQIAFDLLTKPVENVEPLLTPSQEEEEVLAIITTLKTFNISKDKKVLTRLKGRSTPLSNIMRELKKKGMIEVENKIVRPSNLGKAVSLSFLSPSYALNLIRLIKSYKKAGYTDDVALTLGVTIQPFTSAHLVPKVHGDIERAIKATISTNIFSGAVLDLYAGNGWGLAKPTPAVIDTFAKWTKTIFTCKCPDKPFCNCGEINFSKIIANLRRKGYSPTRICSIVRKEYNILIYPGDVYSWLDTLIHHIYAIQRLAKVLHERELEKVTLRCTQEIEHPQKMNKNKE